MALVINRTKYLVTVKHSVGREICFNYHWNVIVHFSSMDHFSVSPSISTKICQFFHVYNVSSLLTCSFIQCLNLTQLLAYYGLTPESAISRSQFTYLCPALLYQIDSRVCIRHYHQMDVEQEALEPISTGMSQPSYSVVLKQSNKNVSKCQPKCC